MKDVQAIHNYNDESQGRHDYLALPIQVGRHRTQALLDTGAVRNFVSSSFVKKAFIKTQKKEIAYELTTATGQSIARDGINKETVPLRIAIGPHQETISFDVLEMATHDFILGMLWLRRNNPTVDWRAKQLRFPRGLIVKAWEPKSTLNGTLDERTNYRYQGMYAMEASQKGRPITIARSNSDRRESLCTKS